MSSSVLRILVAYGSLPLGARILHRVSGIQNVEVVAQVRDLEKVIPEVILEKPHLVILDMFFPTGSGLDALKGVRKRSPAPLTMVTSASGFPQYRKECMKEGADYFFSLPDEIEKMSQAITDLANDFLMHGGGDKV